MVNVAVIKFLDKYVGDILCLLLSIGSLFRGKRNQTYRKILLIQLWGIGETTLSLPTINALRKKYKKSRIDALVTERVKEIYYKNKDLDNIKILKLNPVFILIFILKNYKEYDLAIDMEEYLNISALIAFFTGLERIGYSHNLRSVLYTKKVDYNDGQHLIFTFLDLLKPLGIKKSVEKLPMLNYSPDDKKKVDNSLKKGGINKRDFLIGLGVGAAESSKSRMWPKERFAKLADSLIKKYEAKIIFIGNKEERKLIGKVREMMENKKKSFNFGGKTGIREMFCLISLCRLFVGNDYGLIHVAAAQGVATIGLFGCNLPVRFKPFGRNGYYIYKKDSQDACINVHKREIGECKFGRENACVKKIQVSDVMEVIYGIMGGRGKN